VYRSNAFFPTKHINGFFRHNVQYCLLQLVAHNAILLTYSMERSPSEANRFSASQENLPIIWNPKIHYLIYQSPTTVPILSQINTVHVLPVPLLEDLSSHQHLGLPGSLFPSGFPSKPCMLNRTRCMPHPLRSS
jgi:hypothetical protein